MSDIKTTQEQTIGYEDENNADDAAWIRAARRNPAAFASLYRRYVTPVYRYVYSRLGYSGDAEDVTAQIFTEALASLEGYREEGQFAAWLFTIAARRIADYHRRNRPTFPLDLAEARQTDGRSPLGALIHNETLSHLNRLVADLDEEKQELLRLRFAADLTYAQIGALTGRSEAAVKMAMSRLLRQLQGRWENEHA